MAVNKRKQKHKQDKGKKRQQKIKQDKLDEKLANSNGLSVTQRKTGQLQIYLVLFLAAIGALFVIYNS
jgi:hypothetical protein